MIAEDMLAALPGKIAAALHAEAPQLKEAEAHDGRFDLAELRAFSARAPALRIAFLGLAPDPTAAGPQRRWEIDLAAFLVVRDAPGLGRAAVAGALVQRLVVAIEGRRWGEAALGAAQQVAARNLYGAGTRTQGVALWALTWRQPVTLDERPAAPLRPELYVCDGPVYGAAALADYAKVNDV